MLTVANFAWAGSAILQEKTNFIQEGKIIGFSPILTPIDVLKISKDKTIIKIKGYRLENYPQMVVRDMARGELYAEFEDEEISNKSFKIINKYEDDYGETWHEVEGTFTILSKQVLNNPERLYIKAKKTYERNCSMCHQLPASTAYTVNQWPQQIKSIREHISLGSPTKDLIVKYLQQNAADAK